MRWWRRSAARVTADDGELRFQTAVDQPGQRAVDAGIHPAAGTQFLGEQAQLAGGAATLALQACKNLGASKGELVSYATSGQVSGDMDRVVGYAGLMVY